jgi:hypothetical protein
MAGVFTHLTDDLQTLSQSTRVCRLWWEESHQHLWRHAELRDLFRNVRDVARRTYFASIIRSLYFPMDDATLASEQMLIEPLSFPRLRTLTLWRSNLLDARAANIESLIVPSLRSVALDYSYESDDFVGQVDLGVFLTALLPACPTLALLSLNQFSESASTGALLSAVIGELAAIEHLRLGEIAENLCSSEHPEDFLRSVLSRPRLVTLDFPHGLGFPLLAVNAFLATMGPRWYIPSLQSFGRPHIESIQAAAYLIDRMPNLRELTFELEDALGTWSDNLKCVFSSISKLRQLKLLDMTINLADRDMDCSCLPHLVGFHNLETFCFVLEHEGKVSLSGAQFAAFLSNLPKLNDLLLGLGPLEVLCSPEEKAIIDTVIVRIEKVELGGLIFTTHHTV